MSLLPSDANYLELVQAYFLAFRGDGVSLSPLDAELLGGWMAQGIPYEVVCRGIRKTAETSLRSARPGEGRLRTLRSCRLHVEREFLRYEGMAAGKTVEDTAPKGPEHFAAERLKKARAQLRKALKSAAGTLEAVLQHVLGMLDRDLTDPREVSAAISRADDTLALLYVRRLPFESRVALLREARASAGPKPEGASPRARKDALRAHLVAAARVHGSLPSLS